MDLSQFKLGILSQTLEQEEGLKQYFISENIQVQWFKESQELLDFLKNKTVDLIILDTESPNIYQLCTQIRKIPNQVAIPLVEINKTPGIQQIIQAVNAGFDYLAPSPISQEWLSDFIARLYTVEVGSSLQKNTHYHFNYNEYNLSVDQKRAVSLMMSLAEAYIKDKELVSNYIGSIAHDIRNPLTVITSYLQLLLDLFGDTIPEEGKKILNKIDKSSNHILGMLEELLDISSLDSTQLRLEIAEVSILDIINECYDINKIISEKKDIELVLELQDNLPMIHCDLGKIEQVLSNLLTNAVKFSHPKTKVTLAVTYDDQKLYISVHDQGQGIKQEDHGKIFQDFGKTQTKPTQGEETTGLGLAIAKRIITEHKGEISFTSQFGEGSTFYLSLPLKH